MNTDQSASGTEDVSTEIISNEREPDKFDFAHHDGDPSPDGDRPDGDKSTDSNLRTPNSVKTVAIALLSIFGGSLLLVVCLVFVIALNPKWRESLKDMIGFYGTIVSMLGTLMGGVVAFFFAREPVARK